MGAILRLTKMALANEDSLGKVFAGSSGRGIRTLLNESSAGGTIKGLDRFKNFVNLTETEVKNFDKAVNLASDVFNKKSVGKSVLKEIKKDGSKFGGSYKSYNQKLVNMYNAASDGSLDGTKLSKIFGKEIQNADDIAKSAVKAAKETGLESGIKAAEKTGLKGIFSKAGKFLKGKGGSIAIALSVAFEIPEIIKGFKNGDGIQQIGRSGINLAGFAGGAAAGAAIGSVIPVAGTAVGAVIGGLCGIIGGMVGGAVSEKVGTSIFGKSIAEQKEEVAEQQAQQAASLQEQLLTQETAYKTPLENNYNLSAFA